MEHEFTAQIIDILRKNIGDRGNIVFEKSPLLQYLNIKTRSAARGSKSRSSFANLYAIYVLIEDYLTYGFDTRKGYNKYEGARFTALLERQRELPFGGKLQNHALNHRLNEEFRKYFPEVEYIPILRDVRENRYWFNENLLKVKDGKKTHNSAKAIIEIIESYIQAKETAFKSFIETCEHLKEISGENDAVVSRFIEGLLAPNIDARIFEIVSYAILRFYYHDQMVYFGFDLAHIQSENLQLFKTGRTNANDGGIDFVMRPLGRFFQVTETEEIINIPVLTDCFQKAQTQGYLRQILDEIIIQSKVEFNYENVE